MFLKTKILFVEIYQKVLKEISLFLSFHFTVVLVLFTNHNTVWHSKVPTQNSNVQRLCIHKVWCEKKSYIGFADLKFEFPAKLKFYLRGLYLKTRVWIFSATDFCFHLSRATCVCTYRHFWAASPMSSPATVPI